MLEPQLANDLRQKQADHVCRRRNFVSGPQFFGRRTTAEDVSAFEDADLLPRLRQIGGRNQAVVSAADNHRIVVAVLGHGATSVFETIKFGCLAVILKAAG